MFTGIIQDLGTLKNRKKNRDGTQTIYITTRLPRTVGNSIAVDGVCLTVIAKTKIGFSADVIKETLQRSTLGTLPLGARVNLEPAITAGKLQRLDGHIVSGHVDAKVRIIELNKNNILRLEIPENLNDFIVEKGSIAVNGVALTVTKITPKWCEIALIPFTLRHTNLGQLKKGDRVNIEVDMAARYEKKKTEDKEVKTKKKIVLIVSQFNPKIGKRLLRGAQKALKKHGIASSGYDIFDVPGAFEIPFKAIQLADTKQYAGIIALGAVIKGETNHYEAVCQGVTYGIQKVSIENRIPIMFGVLMCKNEKQALARSQDNPNNKGYECVKSLFRAS